MCLGIGTKFQVDPDLVIPDPTCRSPTVRWFPGRERRGVFQRLLEGVAATLKFDISHGARFPSRVRRAVLEGTGDRPIMSYTNRFGRRREYTTSYEGCPPCGGVTPMRRVIPPASTTRNTCARSPATPARGRGSNFIALAVTVGGTNIHEVSTLSLSAAAQFFDDLELDERQRHIAERVLKEIRARLQFLLDVGLDYLTLARGATTLAGGEAQRIRLATQIGSAWSGCSTSSTSRRSGSTSATTSG